ncbi:MAG: alpha/beta fold hydrolase [Azospirillaceae bacterium]|nr:alpha/beta fold hydrolase [Azospirillaceae bacterium]
MTSTIRNGYADTAAGQIHYRRVDGPHGDAPIVLLHRTPVSSASFAKLLDFLSERHAAIALDSPGFGQSFQPSGRPTAPEYGRWLLDALDALGIDQCHLVGHHTGTHFAAEMAAAAPGRVLSLTLSGVLYAPAEDRAKMRRDIGDAPPIDRAGRHMADTWSLMKSLYPDYDGDLVHAETLGALVAMAGRDQAFDAIFTQDFGDVFRRVVCPVQVVQAADDPLTLGGMLDRFRRDFPQVPVRQIGPAFLATPERQSGQMGRALLDFIHTDRDTTTMTNRAYELALGAGGYDLKRADRAVPTPGAGEVLMRVHTVSVNRRDVSIRDLSYPVNGANHFAPLTDAAGEVVAVGPGVTAWKAGDRVVSTFFQHWADGRVSLPAVMSAMGAGGPGVFADQVILAENGLTRAPEGWSWEEAATLPCAGVTAWRALQTLGQVQEDDWVLIIGTGGVALFAVQIAAAAGAKPIVLSSSDDKIARAKALGAVAGVNYAQTPEWVDAVKAITGGIGVQHVVELGGAGTLPKSLACLGLGGHLAIIGALDGFGGEISALPMVFAGLRASAVLVGNRADQQALSQFMADKGIRPVIDSVFGFDEAEKAYARANAGAFGKVVIRLDGAA